MQDGHGLPLQDQHILRHSGVPGARDPYQELDRIHQSGRLVGRGRFTIRNACRQTSILVQVQCDQGPGAPRALREDSQRAGVHAAGYQFGGEANT